jgi:hypothetical protein
MADAVQIADIEVTHFKSNWKHAREPANCSGQIDVGFPAMPFHGDRIN